MFFLFISPVCKGPELKKSKANMFVCLVVIFSYDKCMQLTKLSKQNEAMKTYKDRDDAWVMIMRKDTLQPD